MKGYQRKYRKQAAAEKAKQRAAETEEERLRRQGEAKKKAEATRELNQQEQAQQELARRELARRHLLPFIHTFQPDYKAGWFHKDLCQRLEQFLKDVVEQKAPRLMLFVPPRHGKSITVSHNFPAWTLGKHPEFEFISTSYAETLQLDFSKAVQGMMRSPEYQKLFPGVGVLKGSEAAARWRTGVNGRKAGGGMVAAGVGGPITGRGAHIAIIDDPVKNADEADSEIMRNAAKSWYSSTLLTRLAPGGGILVVQTRWHDDDLSGWLIHEMEEAIKEEEETGEWPEDADRWEVISYPALATEDEKYRKNGEALHPERYDELRLKKIRRAMIPRHWSALYQQNPVAEEGQFFTKEMLRFYGPNERPKLNTLDIYTASDLAISTKESADYSVFVTAGLDKDDNIWILDVRRGRWDTLGLIDQIVNIYETWHPIRIGIERDKVAIAIGSPLEARKRKDRLFGLITEDLHILGRDKRARARPIQGRMAMGQVKLPKDALWLETWVNEHLRFDSGVNDDCVDAGAWLGQMLAEVTYRNRGPKRQKLKSWREKLKKYTSRGGPGNHMRA